jgi:hypothetical protein
MSRVETVANKNPRGGLLAYTRWTFLNNNNNNNLFVMGFVVCERFPLCVCVSLLIPHSFIDGGFSFLSRGQGDWVKKRWTLLSSEIERDTDKKTRRRRRPGLARLWRKGGWKTGGFSVFCWGLQRKWWRGSATTEWLSLACCFIFLCLYGRRRRRRLGCPSQFLLSLPPPKLTVLLLGQEEEEEEAAADFDRPPRPLK